MSYRLALTLASAGLAVAAACGGDDGGGGTSAPPPPAASATVVLENTQYKPDNVTVFTGGTVTWEWDDGNVVHDVKSGDFKSELQKEGTFEHTFEEAGTYDYVCSVHPSMKGTVTVVDE